MSYGMFDEFVEGFVYIYRNAHVHEDCSVG